MGELVTSPVRMYSVLEDRDELSDGRAMSKTEEMK